MFKCGPIVRIRVVLERIVVGDRPILRQPHQEFSVESGGVFSVDCLTWFKETGRSVLL